MTGQMVTVVISTPDGLHGHAARCVSLSRARLVARDRVKNRPGFVARIVRIEGGLVTEYRGLNHGYETISAKKKMGRPPSDDPRIHAVMVKFTGGEYKRVRSFTERAKVPLAVLVRETMMNRVDRRRKS